MKKIFLTFELLLFNLSALLNAQNVGINTKGESFSHYWSVGIGAGRVNEGLRCSWMEHLKMVKEYCGFKYVRMHGLFHDDMCIYFPKANGKIDYNWQYVDEVYDRMLALGVKPFVELAFFPKEMAGERGKTQFWWKANISVDRNNFGKWHDLVKAFMEHIVERYGIDEVLTWYFEVWNEPNLNPGFLDGSRSDYFQLYKNAVKAVKSVDSRLKVGGPATSNFVADTRFDFDIHDKTKSVFYPQETINKQQWKGVWIEDFLRFCEKENLPVDFVSTHPYPTDYALDPETGRGKDVVRYVHSLKDDISWIKKQLANSKYPNAEIHLTEWSTSPSSRDATHDELPPAAYIIKSNLDCIGMANSLMYWTFTDVFEEKGGGERIFHGGFGMINFQGLVKPSFHAFRMLNELGDEKLVYDEPVFVSRSSRTKKITALAFNYPKEFEEAVPSKKILKDYMNASSKHVNLVLKGLNPSKAFMVETLDRENGNVYKDYQELGSPKSPSIDEINYLKVKAWDTEKEVIRADKDGTLIFEKDLEPWVCILIKEL